MNIQRSKIKEKANYFMLIYFILIIIILLFMIFTEFIKNNKMIYVTTLIHCHGFILGMIIGTEMSYKSIMN
uniref:Uncharacterized protein n=1 Tax=viral metagenome TaxID=1070528 RepID=A0A6C0H594_9ZZZZ